MDQSNATTASKAADAAMQRAAETAAAAAAAAGFPKGPPVVHGQDLGRNAQNPVAIMAAQAAQAAFSGGPNNSAAALGSEKSVHDVSNQQNSKGAGKNSAGQASKHARISEEPAEVHEVGNSNKIPDTGAMTDGSKNVVMKRLKKVLRKWRQTKTAFRTCRRMEVLRHYSR